jgi:hypothetical protein
MPLDPDIAEWMRRQQGAQAPVAGPPSPDDLSALAAPPPAAAAPAQPSAIDSYMASMRDFVNRYANPDQLARAQASDRRNIEANRFAQAMGNATGLMINNPGSVRTPEAVPLDVKQYMERMQLGKDTLGLKSQLLTMPYTLRKTMAETAKAEAEPGKITADTQAALAGIPKTQAEARKAGAEASASEIENGPAAPAMLAMGAKLGISLPPTTTNKQARETIDAEAKRQGLAVDWEKLGVEKGKIKVELARYGSEHPDEPVPGYTWAGPQGTAAPSRDSPEVATLGEKVAASGEMKTILGEMRDIYDRNGTQGRLVGGDATRLDQLHEKLLGTIGRAASGGKLAAYDITLAHDQLPRPSDIKGALRPDKIHAAIDQLTKDADVGHREWAKAHNFRAKGGAAPGGPPVPGAVQTKSGRWATKNAAGQLEYVGGE